MTTKTLAWTVRAPQIPMRALRVLGRIALYLARPMRWHGIRDARADVAQMRNEWLQQQFLLAEMKGRPPLTPQDIDHSLPERIRRGEA